VLFVGTKKQAQEIVRKEAERSGMYYINNRWLGGMLTNFRTMKGSIDRLNSLEKMQSDGKFGYLTKKEVLTLEREIEKLNKALGGIKDMRNLPGALFVIDVKKERIAIHEARRLAIPIVAVVDTNCDPEGIQYVIPGNDDALKSIQLFASRVADACLEGVHMSRDVNMMAEGRSDERPSTSASNVEVVNMNMRRTSEEATESAGDLEA